MSPQQIGPSIQIVGLQELIAANARVEPYKRAQLPHVVSSIARKLANIIQKAAPHKTGHLQASFAIDGTNLQLTIYSTSDYLKYVVGGTRPHIILPKYKEALYWPGAAHPVYMVRHPGYRGADFVRRAYTQAEMEQIWEADLQRLANGIESTWVA